MTGNQLAVVHDADGVDDATMAAFARETRLSETTFVQSPTRDGADYRNRIWMMRGELDFAGHPSLGTAVAMALASGERAASYVQQTPAGLQPIDVELAEQEGLARASMLQEPADLGDELDPAEALAGDVAHPELPAQVVSCGVPQVIVPVTSLDGPAPAYDALEALLDRHRAVTLYRAVIEDDGTARARSFYLDPGAVVSEDPATGSAAGPLMAYLHARSGATELDVAQGVEMGRPSRLLCSIDGDRVRVAGDAVVVARGTVSL